VEQTADKVGGVQYDQNGHNDHYGYGRVNAARAVRAAELGLNNSDGEPCAEDVNCASGVCLKENPEDPQGLCSGDVDGGGDTDGGLDGGQDAGNDAGLDAGSDLGTDLGTDLGADLGYAALDLGFLPCAFHNGGIVLIDLYL